MGIVNRTLDASEQKQVISRVIPVASTSLGTFLIWKVPFSCEVKQVNAVTRNISGTPSVVLQAYKFSGGVTINANLSTALAMVAFSTSGSVGTTLLLAASGSSLVQLAANDMLVAQVTGANSAAEECLIECVIQCLQDVKSY